MFKAHNRRRVQLHLALFARFLEHLQGNARLVKLVCKAFCGIEPNLLEP